MVILFIALFCVALAYAVSSYLAYVRGEDTVSSLHTGIAYAVLFVAIGALFL